MSLIAIIATRRGFAIIIGIQIRDGSSNCRFECTEPSMLGWLKITNEPFNWTSLHPVISNHHSVIQPFNHSVIQFYNPICCDLILSAVSLIWIMPSIHSCWEYSMFFAHQLDLKKLQHISNFNNSFFLAKNNEKKYRKACPPLIISNSKDSKKETFKKKMRKWQINQGFF